MNEGSIEVTIRGLLPAPGGAGVFLEGEGKVMTVFIDPMVSRALQMAMNGESPPRPLTHNLLEAVLVGLGAKLLRVVIYDCREETYFARLHLQQENELGKSYLEVDCRPSDAMVLAVLLQAPVRVSRPLWEKVEDMKWALDQLDEDGSGD